MISKIHAVYSTGGGRIEFNRKYAFSAASLLIHVALLVVGGRRR